MRSLTSRLGPGDAHPGGGRAPGRFAASFPACGAHPGPFPAAVRRCIGTPVKTLTELSGSVIRVAAAAIAEARRSLPSEQKPAEPAVPAPAPAPAPAQDAAAPGPDATAETAAQVEAPA